MMVFRNTKKDCCKIVVPAEAANPGHLLPVELDLRSSARTVDGRLLETFNRGQYGCQIDERAVRRIVAGRKCQHMHIFFFGTFDSHRWGGSRRRCTALLVRLRASLVLQHARLCKGFLIRLTERLSSRKFMPRHNRRVTA